MSFWPAIVTIIFSAIALSASIYRVVKTKGLETTLMCSYLLIATLAQVIQSILTSTGTNNLFLYPIYSILEILILAPLLNLWAEKYKTAILALSAYCVIEGSLGIVSAFSDEFASRSSVASNLSIAFFCGLAIAKNKYEGFFGFSPNILSVALLVSHASGAILVASIEYFEFSGLSRLHAIVYNISLVVITIVLLKNYRWKRA